MKRFITLPNGKHVSLGTYTKAWQKLKRLHPDTPIRGWGWHFETAGQIIYQIRQGIHDRINAHYTQQTTRDHIQDMQADRDLIESALQRRTFRSGSNLLRTRYFRKRYPHLNHRLIETV